MKRYIAIVGVICVIGSLISFSAKSKVQGVQYRLPDRIDPGYVRTHRPTEKMIKERQAEMLERGR